MTTELAAFPDIEAGLVTHLAGVLSVDVVTVTPADLQQRLPTVRVTRIGGPDDGLTDRARVDVTVLAATRREVWTAAERARQVLLAAAAVRTGDTLIDDVATETGPSEIPWTDPAVRVVTMTFRVTARRPV